MQCTCKIFYGTGTPESIVGLVSQKHKGEKFLITSAQGANVAPLTSLFDKAQLDYSTCTLVKGVSQDLHGIDLHTYDIVVLYNPSDVVSLKENFPDFKQENIKFVSFGKSVVKAMEDAGIDIAFKAPTPEAPSVGRAIELYLSNSR